MTAPLNLALSMLAFYAMGAARAGLGDVHAAITCPLLRDVQEDPIVSPGAVSDHLHSVYGAHSFGRVVDVATAFGNNVATTCVDERDKSMYWTPSLMFRGAAVPSSSRVYLLEDTRGGLSPFPLGLRVIAADPEHREWRCVAPKLKGQPRAETLRYEALPALTTPSGVRCARWQVRQEFPSCWNGVDLDSEDHASHLAYPVRSTRTCPATHPVALPQLRMVVSYHLPTDPSVRRAEFQLSAKTSDDGRKTHFDFISGWDETALTKLLQSPVRGGEDRRADRA